MDAFIGGARDEFVIELAAASDDDLAAVGEELVGGVPARGGEGVGSLLPVVGWGEADMAD